ncbi:MAG: hypothetical protein QXH03_03290 [Candidatus Bathyarchaeia archaeon]
MARNRRRDALIHAELGMGFYIVSFAIFFWVFFLYPLFFFETALNFLAIGILSSSPPLLLAWLTHIKIVKLLKEGSEPSIKWAKSLEILGYFLGLFIAGLMLYIANKKLESKEHSKLI